MLNSASSDDIEFVIRAYMKFSGYICNSICEGSSNMEITLECSLPSNAYSNISYWLAVVVSWSSAIYWATWLEELVLVADWDWLVLVLLLLLSKSFCCYSDVDVDDDGKPESSSSHLHFLFFSSEDDPPDSPPFCYYAPAAFSDELGGDPPLLSPPPLFTFFW